jgi:transcriptional regulator with XRE-family HTH domain
MEYIGQMVKALRKQKNLTQLDLANLSGVGKSTIENIESGKHINLELKTMVLLFTALDFPSIPIISHASTEEERSKLINEIVGVLAACDQETLRAAYAAFDEYIKMIEIVKNRPLG